METKKISKPQNNQALKDFFFINVGIIMIAVGLYFFRNPNNFAFGGISGLSIVLGYFFPSLPVGSIMLILNVILIVIAFIFLGKNFVVKTLYSSLTISGLIWVFEILFPMDSPLTNQQFVELLYGVFLPGIGIGLIFHSGATTGGTDIIAKIISKYFKLKMSVSLLLSDLLIAASAGALFGMETFLYSMLGLVLSTFVMDSFIESLQTRKVMVIISEKSTEIENYVCNTLSRGATVHTAYGAYNNDEKRVITTVLSKHQASRLQQYIKELDPTAFITITNSSRIIGMGFDSFE